MALRQFTTAADGTIPIPALLYNDEDLLASQDSVGIYDGLQKAANHQSGTMHVSSHRLFFVNAHQPISHSFSLDLRHIARTDYYAGLFMSSPKVTLYLDSTFIPPSGYQEGTNDGFESWICGVCGHRNPPGLSPAAARVCALCGVPKSVLSGSPPPGALTLSSSRPASSVSVGFSALPGLSTPPPTSTTACTACTFLNHPSLRNCEICSTPLPLVVGSAAAGFGSNSKSAPSSRPVSPPIDDSAPDPANPLIKLSFRKGGDKAFYATLRRALKARTWEGRQIGRGLRSGTLSLGAASPEGGSTPGSLRRTGIDGILRNVETSAQNTETQLSDAFQDLEALMVKAQDLVHLAAELNEKLNNGSGSNDGTGYPPGSTGQTSAGTLSGTSPLASEPEEARFVRSSLAQLGLQLSNAPVTANMMQDEKRWMEELARELARVLQGTADDGPGGMMKERGIIGLDEVWGGWNRARGVALIPPSTFLEVVHYLPWHTHPPVRRRVFGSGLQVLHTPPYTHAGFSARLSSYLTISGTQTTSEIAREEDINVSLAGEMILAVEADGVVCRDDESSAIRGGGSELRWVQNNFDDYIWDGQAA